MLMLCYLIRIIEGVTQGNILSMVLYILSFLPLYNVIKEEEPGVLYPWYVEDVAMVVPAGQSAKLLCILNKNSHPMGTYRSQRRYGMYVGR